MRDSPRAPQPSAMDSNAFSPERSLRRTRRIACDVCRERKVRCDRGQPSCERCIRLGNRCTYTFTVLRKKSNPSSVNIQELLMQMHSRLARAEVHLAKNHTTDTQFDFDSAVGNPFSEQALQTTHAPESFEYFQKNSPAPATATGSSSTPSPRDPPRSSGLSSQTDGDLWEQWMQESNFPEFDDGLHATTTSNFITHLPELNMDDLQTPPIPASLTSAVVPVVEESSLHYLYQSYFDTVHPVLPMIDRERFEAETKSAHCKSEFDALRYAVAMVGAAASDDQADTAETCYALARSNIEKAEREDSGEPFLTISAVQTLLLIVFYEFKKKSLARTWMSIGRAMRLAKAMELDHLDRDTTEGGKSGFQVPLPPTNNLTEMEERRKTFWVAYIFDSYVSVRTGCSPTFDRMDTSTYMPMANAVEDFQFLQPRFRLMEFINNPIAVADPLTLPMTGLAIMAALASMILEHVKAAGKRKSYDNDPSYPFWSEHFRLDRTISTVITSLLDRNPQYLHQQGVGTLLLSLNLNAVAIYLHELAIERSEWDKNVPIPLVSESHNRSDHAGMAIVASLQLIKTLNIEEEKTFKQLNTFTMWSLSVAAGALIRMLRRSQDPATAGRPLSALRVLQSAIVDLEDESVSFGNLLEDVVMQLTLYDNSLVSPAH